MPRNHDPSDCNASNARISPKFAKHSVARTHPLMRVECIFLTHNGNHLPFGIRCFPLTPSKELTAPPYSQPVEPAIFLSENAALLPYRPIDDAH